jgi:[ribosomal protein S5]-alanine N-acetyltransferase
MEGLIVDHEITLTKFSSSDKPFMIKYLNDPEIYNTTLLIPFPYKEEDADGWLTRMAELDQKGKQSNWAIRKNGELIGAISRKELYGENAHKDEIGYWLARPFRGQGIMTRVVGSLCSYLIRQKGLIRIEAPVFEHNIASKIVLKKNGFEFEGTLRKFYLKNEKTIDADMYALLAEDYEKRENNSY